MNNRSYRLGKLALALTGGLALTQPASAQLSVSGNNLTATFDTTNATGGITLTTTGGATATTRTLLNGALSRLYFRVNGIHAENQPQNTARVTYIVGASSALAPGTWVTGPSLIGNRIEGVWQTGVTPELAVSPNVLNATNPNIQVKVVITIVGTLARVQYTIKNIGGVSRIIDAAFIEDINVSGGIAPTVADGPIRVDNGPYLDRETLLLGNQIPSSFESVYSVAAATQTSAADLVNIRGVIAPLNTSEVEPTRPYKVAYAAAADLSYFAYDQGVVAGSLPNKTLWNFVPDPTITFRGTTSLNKNAAIALYFLTSRDFPSQFQADIVTYIGLGGASGDYSAPLSLEVASRPALNYNQGVSGPTSFPITATVSNLRALTNSSGLGLNSGPVSVSLTLPTGLELADGSLTQNIADIAAGGESSVTWNVRANGAASGKLNYTVSAGAALIGAKTVTRSLEVPAPAKFILKGKDTAGIKYRMISFPLDTATATGNALIGLGDSDYDIVRYDPLAPNTVNPYKSVKQSTGEILPGYGYWIYSRLNVDATISINTTLFKPLDQQVQPTAVTLTTKPLPRGWFIVGNPYVYGIKFSELSIYDDASKRVLSVSDAADPANGWILPVAYRWDTSDPDSRNWRYVLQDNLGFTIQPYDAYWINLRKSNLQIIFPGADVPGGAVTRAAISGNGPGSALGLARRDNWRLRLQARSQTGLDTDNYIGVAPRATDGLDVFKYDKPPTLGNRLTLDLVMPKLNEGGRYAQDLRSPLLGAKTWNLVVRSGAANEDVTVTWPEIAAAVPRDYMLTLVDPVTNARIPMRSRASYVVNTGASSTRELIVEATPTRGAGRVKITSLDVSSNLTRATGAAPTVLINYSTSQATEMRILVRDRSGRTIRTLTSTTRAAEAGSGSVVWDLRNGQGAGVPSGVYSVEVVAVGQDGQTDRQVRPYVLTR